MRRGWRIKLSRSGLGVSISRLLSLPTQQTKPDQSEPNKKARSHAGFGFLDVSVELFLVAQPLRYTLGEIGQNAIGAGAFKGQ